MLGAVAAAVLVTSSCSLVGGGRSAGDEARALAAALHAGKPGTVAFTEGGSRQAQRM